MATIFQRLLGNVASSAEPSNRPSKQLADRLVNRLANRLDWVDAVKGLGIVLMFYGHFLQSGTDHHNASAVDQFRLIYSFHMPMFFVVSGFFFHRTEQTANRIGQLALRRLVPVAFFSAVFFPIWFGDEIAHHVFMWHNIIYVGRDYIVGRPDLDWVTWFLVCLFVCECMAVVFIRKTHSLPTLIVMGFLCLASGLLFCAYSHSPADGVLYTVGRTWFFSEAFVALGFYLIGYALFPHLQKLAEHRQIALLILPLALGIVFVTFRLNHPSTTVVMMAARQHGNPVDFVVTALAGTAAMLMLGILLRRSDLLVLIGRNSLPLLGLNGLFLDYLDPLIGHVLKLPDSEFVVALDALIITGVSLLLCAPLVYLLNRLLPQLVGKTRVHGPWLPAFERRQYDRI